MNDDELDVLVASTAPVTDADVDRVAAHVAAADLLEEIMTIDVADLADTDTLLATAAGRGRRPRGVARAVATIVGAAAVVVVAVSGLLVVQRGHGGSSSAWAAELVAVAESSPRLVVDGRGWHVVRADELTAENGEMTFTDGPRRLELRWQPVREHEYLVKDRASGAAQVEHVTVLGHPGVQYRYRLGGASEYFTTVWSDDRHTLEARGEGFGTIDAYESVVGHLREVDADAWLSAMPPTVIKPAETAATVDAMLADVPKPDGFAVVLPSGQARDRYQLGAAVVGQVACRWVEAWITATDAGDAAAAARAVDAMSSSRRWKVLVEMKADGYYPDAVREVADAMRTGAPIMGGKPLTIREAYRDELGCAG
jgi:hypothetical protein